MTEDLSTWLSQEHLTDLEFTYWIPKYIMVQGDKPFASLRAMSPRMKALAINQDKIGRQNFMEGCISTHFYFIQHYHLALSGSYLNRSDWTKSLISKLIHITHWQWIYRNFILHNKLCGCLQKKNLENIRLTIEDLTDTTPEEKPEESKFLFEINLGNFTKSHIQNQQYWVIDIQAAITAGQRAAVAGSRGKRIRHTVNLNIPSRTKLGITAVEMQIRRDHMHSTAEEDTFSLPTESTINKYLKKWPHPGAIFAQYRSNKWICKPD